VTFSLGHGGSWQLLEKPALIIGKKKKTKRSKTISVRQMVWM